MSSKVKY